MRRGCFSKTWLLPDNYKHTGRNNNNNIEGRSRTQNNNKNSKSKKQNYNFNTNNMQNTIGDGWVGWSNINNTAANSKVTFVK